jgi:peptidoglycan/LPS O-acetylase OafA/YrhL
MRAVAILLIVAYHAEIPGFGGGFVGVDVFFVISGYLITRRLLAEGEREGRVRLLAFWAKRVRRLVPAMTLMVVVTLAASVTILPSLRWREVAGEGLAAGLYVSNLLFAHQAQNYFGADIVESPFLHTWSLGVEEQFYLLWPLLVLGGAVASRRRGVRLPPALAVGFAGVFVGSFAMNLIWTDQRSAWAFFGLPTRAWEFALAGLLALVTVHPSATRRSVPFAAGGAGLVLVLFAALTFSANTPYPGTAALVPVIGTMALIYAGEHHATRGSASPVGVVLGARASQWVGRVSYSWYLWHWPFIVLAVAAIDDSALVRVAAAVASLPVAYLAHRLVENPIRFDRRLVASIPRTFALGAAALAIVLAGFGVVVGVDSRAPADSLDSRIRAVRNLDGLSCATTATSSSGIRHCIGGDIESDVTVLLVGDSHATTWRPALFDAAAEAGVTLAALDLPGCPAIEIRIRREPLDQVTESQCADRRRDAALLVDDLEPAVVLLAEGNIHLGAIENDDGEVPGEAEQVSLWKRAFRTYLDSLSADGVQRAVILDNPNLPDDPNSCISREQAIDPCVPSREEALGGIEPLRRAELGVLAELGDVPYFSPIDLLCDDATCALEIDGQLVYSDEDHLGLVITAGMRDHLVELLEQALERR